MTPDFANTHLQIAQIVSDSWREVLGLAVVDPNKNFFDVGGTSVHAILLHGKLRERLPDYDFSVMAIFKHPTIAEFLDAIVPASGTDPRTPANVTPAPAKPSAFDGRAVVPVMSARERAAQQRSAAARPPWAMPRS